MWNYKRAYIFLNRVSCSLGIGDAVLHNRTIGMFPAHRESTGGGVIYAHVPWATTGHWARKHEEKCVCLCFTFQTSLCLRGAQVPTCLSVVSDSGSFAVAVQGNHSNIVISVWEQLLQQGCGGGPWYHNLHKHTENVKTRHFRRAFVT